MIAFVLYIILAVITLSAVTLQKTYNHIPRRELRRRAQAGDELAKLLFHAASYGSSLEIVLWFIIGLGATSFFVLVSWSLPGWAAMLGSLALLWLGFAWLPYTRVSDSALRLARYATPPLAWLLQKIYPLISWFAETTEKWRVSFHTGLYEKEDLLDLINIQAEQHDSRVSEEELKLMRNALTFGDKIIRDVMVPIKSATTVSTNDAIGPILMTELHKKGHSSFPVHPEGKKQEIIGTLYLRDLIDFKGDGRVKDVMRSKVYYIHDEEPLDQALQLFLKNKHHLFVVTNNFEDIVGVVAIEDILEQLIEPKVGDEFDRHDSRQAVAEHHKAPKVEEVEAEPSESDQEMVVTHEP